MRPTLLITANKSSAARGLAFSSANRLHDENFRRQLAQQGEEAC
jgi:hypothetical protein